MKLQWRSAIYRIDRPCQAHTQRLTSSSYISVRIRSRPRSCATAADAAAQPALPVRDRRPHSRAASSAAGGPAATRTPDQHARHGRRRRRHSRGAAEYILALHRNGGGAGAAGYHCAAACGVPHAGQPAVLQVHFSQAHSQAHVHALRSRPPACTAVGSTATVSCSWVSRTER